MKKLLLFIMILSIALLSLASCGKCKEHIDQDGNNLCDKCEAVISTECQHVDEDDDMVCDKCEEVYIKPTEKIEVDVVFTVADQDAEVIGGITVTLVNQKGGTPIVCTSAENGTFSAKVEVGNYNVSYDYNADLIGYYLADTSKISVTEKTTAITLNMINNNPNGTASRPFVPYYGENEITVPAGETYYFTVYRAVNQIVVVNSADVKVVYKTETYTPEAGILTFALLGEDTNSVETFSIENTSSAEISFTYEITSLPGTMGNPLVISALGEAVVSPAMVEGQILYYTYTATADGTLTLTLETVGAYASVMNTSNSITERIADTGSVSLTVKAGDVINIDCGYTVSGGPATDVVFTLTQA